MLFYKRKNGFTLIELLVALALATILFLTVGSSFIRVVNFHSSIKGDSNVISNISFAFDIMRRYVQNATVADSNTPSPMCVGGINNTFKYTNHKDFAELHFLYTEECFNFIYEDGQLYFNGKDEEGNPFSTALIDTDRVELQNVVFDVRNGEIVTVFMEMRPKKSRRSRSFQIQTSFSVRHYARVDIQGTNSAPPSNPNP